MRNLFKSNYTRPIGCRVFAVKCSKNDHWNFEECPRQLTRMMDLMSFALNCISSTLSACAMIPNQQNFTRHDERFNFSTIFSGCQIGQVRITFKSDQAQWFHLEFLLTESKIFWIFLLFSPNFRHSPKDLEDSKPIPLSFTRRSLARWRFCHKLWLL